MKLAYWRDWLRQPNYQTGNHNMNRTEQRINKRIEGWGRNVRWTHWVTNDGLECNDTLCTMHRRELCDQFAGVTSKPQLEDENFGCNDCEGDKAYD